MQQKLHKWFCSFIAVATLFLTGVISAQTSPTDVYKLVESDADFTSGYYVIGASTGENANFAMTTTLNSSNYFNSTSITVTNNEVQGVSSNIVWYVERNGNVLTIKNPSTNQFVAYTSTTTSSSGSNNAWYITNGADTKAQWNIEPKTGSLTYEIYFKNVFNTIRRLSYNSGSPRFACYGNTGQTAIRLYKYDEAAVDQPMINLTTTTVTGLGYEVGQPSVEKSFDYTIQNITEGPFIVTSENYNANFEVNVNDNGWGFNLVTESLPYTSGTINVRLSAGLAPGTYTNRIRITAGDVVRYIDVTGTVTAPIVRPANDLCENAIEIFRNEPATAGTMVNATYSSGFWENDVWYKYVADYTGPHTFTLTGFAGDLDLDLYAGTCPSNDSNYFGYAGTSNPTEVINAELTAGQTYYIRPLAYNSAAANSVFTISVTGTAPVPTLVYADTTTFTGYYGEPLTATVTVTGQYLSNSILFTTPEGAIQSLEFGSTTATSAQVTLIFNTNVLGESTGSFTAFSEGVSLTIPVVLNVGLPTPIATAATAITHEGFTANWNAVAGATAYELSVYDYVASSTTAINEGFAAANGTGGNDGLFSGSAAGSAIGSVLPSWTFVNGYKGDGCVRIGTSSSLGSATSPAFGVAGSGKVSFRAAAWGTDNTNLKISLIGGGALSQSTVTMVRGEFNTYELTITGATAATKIKFEGNGSSNSRFFLDDVVVELGSTALNLVQGPINTTATSYVVTGLDTETTYAYNVVATAGAIESEVSNTIEVTTTENPTFAFATLTIEEADCATQTAAITFTGLPANEAFTVLVNGNEFALLSDANGVATADLTSGVTSFYVASIVRDAHNFEVAVDATYNVVYNVLTTYYVDADGDGYGDDSLPTIQACAQPAGYAALAGDCNDNAALVNPGMSEILYNGIDDNCDGNLDEGHQVTTRVISAQCGTTLSAVTTTIHVNSNSRATAYRFKVYNMSTQEENIIERNTNYFGLADLPMGGTYGTTYRVSAELQYYGIWLGYYGEECYVSTPPHINDAQGSTTTCDTQLEAITSIVHTYAGTNVEYYRFKFTHYDENNEEVVEIVDRERPWINFSTLATAKYGTTYMVEVATKLRSSASYSAYAAPCIIISPDVPAIESCGAQAATSNTTFLVQTAAQVRSWRFELTNMETFETMTIVRPIRYIRFVDMPNYQPGAEYGIRVSVMANGNWSPYGPACSIWAPMAVARQDIATTQFEVAAYPNTFDNDFRLKVTMPTQDRVEVRLFDMLGKQVDTRVLDAADVEYAFFGKNLPAGVYNVVVTQGTEVKTVRVIRK